MDISARMHAFEGVQNFRDFGGYVAGDRRMATGRFFRSANHALASETDLARLADMNIATIVDLRRPEERKRQPSRRWREFGAAVIENHDEFEGEESWDRFIREWDLTIEGYRGFQFRYYTQAPHLPRLVDHFARYFDAVASTDGPVLVHCAAGKDRTGLIVALTHHLAGVHPDDIVADYLLTNDSGRSMLFAPVWRKQLHEMHGRAPSMEVIGKVLECDAAYLARSLDVIGERHGDVETYLRDVLGVDAAKRAAIERKLFG